MFFYILASRRTDIPCKLQGSTKSEFECSLRASFQSFIWEQVKSEAKDGYALDHANKGSLLTVGVVSYTSTV